MPGQNLTRDEAASAQRSYTSTAYGVDLDFSAGGDTFDSVTEIRFTATEPGASTFVDLVADAGARDHAERPGARSGQSPTPTAGSPSTGSPPTNVVRIAADCAYTNTGAGPAPHDRSGRRPHLPLHALRGAGRAPAVRDASSSPTSRRRSRSRSPRRPAGRCCPTRRRPRRSPSRDGVCDLAVRADAADLDVHDRGDRRRVPRRARLAHHAGRAGRSRSRSPAARRWPSTSTPTTSSRSPSRASTTTSDTFAQPVPVRRSTTRSSCPSTTSARWRTSAA